MIAITHTGQIITDPIALKAYLASIKPRRYGRVKKKVAIKKQWQTALKEVAAGMQTSEVTKGRRREQQMNQPNNEKQAEKKDMTAEMQAELEARFPDDPFREAARVYVDVMKELVPESFE